MLLSNSTLRRITSFFAAVSGTVLVYSALEGMLYIPSEAIASTYHSVSSLSLLLWVPSFRFGFVPWAAVSFMFFASIHLLFVRRSDFVANVVLLVTLFVAPLYVLSNNLFVHTNMAGVHIAIPASYWVGLGILGVLMTFWGSTSCLRKD